MRQMKMSPCGQDGAFPVRALRVAGMLLGLLAGSAALGQTAVGWRTDGTGRYPDANPPPEWSANSNILWKTAMPAPGYATPIIVGNRVIAAAEKDLLLCLEADTGKILWQTTNGHQQAYSAEELKAGVTAIEKAKQCQRERLAIREAMKKAREELKAKPGDAAAKAQVEDLTKQLGEKDKAVAGAEKSAAPYSYDYVKSDNGYAICTPVSDGQRVWMLYGTGVLVCYDLEGKRQWIRMTEVRNHGWGQTVSPLLVGGILVAAINDLVAFDPGTGKEVWRTSAQVGQPYHGSLIAACIGGVDVIVTPNGDIVRAGDGKKLAQKLFYEQCTSPVVQDGVLYLAMGGGVARAFALPEKIEGETIKLAKLWEAKIDGGQTVNSPLYHDGLLYNVPRETLNAVDARTGTIVYKQKLDIGGVWSSPALAGQAILVSGKAPPGVVVAIKPGREFARLSRNILEGSGEIVACPVAVGDRLYLRGQKILYCVGR